MNVDHVAWQDLWREVQWVLWTHRYTRSTMLLYRQVLRSFSRHTGKPPRLITPEDAEKYLATLSRDRCTWHWAAMNLSVLRTVFDKLGGLKALVNRRGPRRKRRLPEYLNRGDIVRLIDAAGSLRDQMLIALLYGCGLKTGEVQRITWRDIDLRAATIRVPSRWGRADRKLPIPELLKPMLAEGLARCPPEQLLFADPSGRRGLSARRIQQVVREAAERSGMDRVVLPVTLRHSYAVHFLQDGGNLRQLQEHLDHCLLETTARYLDLVDVAVREPTPPRALKLGSNASFLQDLVDPFVRKIFGLRQYHNSA